MGVYSMPCRALTSPSHLTHKLPSTSEGLALSPSHCRNPPLAPELGEGIQKLQELDECHQPPPKKKLKQNFDIKNARVIFTRVISPMVTIKFNIEYEKVLKLDNWVNLLFCCCFFQNLMHSLLVILLKL